MKERKENQPKAVTGIRRPYTVLLQSGVVGSTNSAKMLGRKSEALGLSRFVKKPWTNAP